MSAFTQLEIAALHCIFSETPKHQAQLERQLGAAIVTRRKNTGAGFFTYIIVSDTVPPISTPSHLGTCTFADVLELEHGFGFVLFMQEGKLHMLEGWVVADDSTVSLDLDSLSFEVHKRTVHRRD